MALRFNGKDFINLSGEYLNLEIEFSNNGNCFLLSNKAGIFDLYLADENDQILEGYERIGRFFTRANIKSYFNVLNDFNICTQECKRFVVTDVEKIKVFASGPIPESMQPTLGTFKYSVGLLSDTHVDGNGDGNNYDTGASQDDFKNALQIFNNNGVDFACICGDISYDGYSADYTAFKNIVDTYANGLPIKTVKGNHDCYDDGVSNPGSTRLEEVTGNPQYYEYIHNGDVYLFLGMYGDDRQYLFSNEETKWAIDKIESYKNQRVFLFCHYYYGPVGNAANICWHKYIEDTVFIALIKKYKNVVYFSGHTHMAFYLQKYEKTGNVNTYGDICTRVHIPSCAKPRKSDTGRSSSSYDNESGSEGYIMDVYDNGILLKGYNFITNKIEPIATYFLPTEGWTVADSSTYLQNPTSMLGHISSSTGETDSEMGDCISDYVYIKGKPEITFFNAEGLAARFFIYDQNKRPILQWFTDDSGSTYNYKYVGSRASFTFPDNAYYIRARIADVARVIPLYFFYQ